MPAVVGHIEKRDIQGIRRPYARCQEGVVYHLGWLADLSEESSEAIKGQRQLGIRNVKNSMNGIAARNHACNTFF